MIRNYQEQIHADLGELADAADILAARPHHLALDEKGYYHVQSSGTLEEVIPAVEGLLEKLKRIKQSKESYR